MMLPILDYATLDQNAQRQALSRPAVAEREQLIALVRETVARVRAEGDSAVLDYARRFDGGEPESLRVPLAHLDAALQSLAPTERQALERAIDNVRRFHAAQLPTPLSIETSPGVRCERITRPIHSVGLYVPGG